ncbi:hypothetical protein Bca52824_080953 [Brassica carinata]|uniref:Uncharacterized protein n=1 Tax=Brassica carinata TaxID=52824 RepID=A0A8X7TQT4_BRACI|nr:hypothetical protein Bca52824_080953 [Brassica carinata]
MTSIRYIWFGKNLIRFGSVLIEDMGFNKDVLFIVGENVQSVTREIKRMRQKGSRWLDELPENRQVLVSHFGSFSRCLPFPLYRRNRRPVGRLERLVDESHSVVLSEASSRGFLAPFGRSENVAVRDATECARDGQSGAVPVDSITLRARAVEDDPSEDDDSEAELFPTTFYPEGIFEELPRLHPDLLRPAFVAGQDWDGVDETKSTLRSVKRVLRANNATGVTFLIPTKEQRPWSPPIGYKTVYESYFQDDTRCWFPIPRLITAYARRRDLAISQLLNGSLRLAVTLSMRPNCNVCAGHPNKTQNWQRSYFFIKSDDSAFEEPPREDYRVVWNRSCVGHPTSPVYPEDFLKSVRAVALLRIYRWSEITWRSDLPTVLPIRTKRLDIFSKDIQKQVSKAKRMGTLPDLSAILAAQLGLASEEGPSTTVPRAGDIPPSGRGAARESRGAPRRRATFLLLANPRRRRRRRRRRGRRSPLTSSRRIPKNRLRLRRVMFKKKNFNQKRRLLRLKSRENGTMRRKLVKGRNLKLLLMPPVRTVLKKTVESRCF